MLSHFGLILFLVGLNIPMCIVDPKEKRQLRHPLTDAVFNPTSCESFSLCDHFKTLLGLPGQMSYWFDKLAHV